MDKQFYIRIDDYKKILDTISILQLEVVKLKNQIEVLKKVREIEQKIIEKIKEEVESIVSTLREIKESLETKV